MKTTNAQACLKTFPVPPPAKPELLDPLHEATRFRHDRVRAEEGA